MSESREENLSRLAEEFRINQGLEAEEHISLLKCIEQYPKDVAVTIFNHFLSLEMNPQVLIYLIKTLAKYNSESSVDVLSELLLWKEKFKDQNRNPDEYLKVRSMVANVLGSMKNSKAVLPLLYVLNNKDENYKLRLSCAEALGKIGNSYAVAPLIDVVTDETEKSIYVRESAAKALGLLGDIRAIDPLVAILETKKGLIDKFTFLKERIIESIGRIGSKDDKALRVLKNALMDEAPYIRLGAIEALSEIEDERVIPLIEKMLDDEEEDVARGAVNALYNLTGIEYIQELYNRENLASWCKDETECILEEYNSQEEEFEEDE